MRATCCSHRRTPPSTVVAIRFNSTDDTRSTTTFLYGARLVGVGERVSPHFISALIYICARDDVVQPTNAVNFCQVFFGGACAHTAWGM